MKALEALADPTRRTIVELLAEQELSAGQLAARFETSRPAVSLAGFVVSPPVNAPARISQNTDSP